MLTKIPKSLVIIIAYYVKRKAFSLFFSFSSDLFVHKTLSSVIFCWVNKTTSGTDRVTLCYVNTIKIIIYNPFEDLQRLIYLYYYPLVPKFLFQFPLQNIIVRLTINNNIIGIIFLPIMKYRK